jgi:hypothetical protein
VEREGDRHHEDRHAAEQQQAEEQPGRASSRLWPPMPEMPVAAEVGSPTDRRLRFAD